MKIAICFSGQPRHIDRNINFWLENIIQPFKADVFYHFWKPSPTELIDDWTKTIWSMDYYSIARLDALEGHMQYQIDFRDYVNEQRNSAYSKQNTLSMLYSMWRVNQIKLEYEMNFNFKYDIVVRARTDVRIPKAINFEEVIPDTIYCEFRNTPGDQLMYGDSQTMDYLTKCFTEINQHDTMIHPETLITYQCNRYGIKRLPIDVHTLIR